MKYIKHLFACIFYLLGMCMLFTVPGAGPHILFGLVFLGVGMIFHFKFWFVMLIGIWLGAQV